MEFGVPDRAEGAIRKADEFVARVIEPLEEEYDHFLGRDGRRNRLDDDGVLCREFNELRDQIRRKSAADGILAMHLPEEMGGEGASLLEYLLVTEYVNDRDPDGFHELMLETPMTGAYSVLHRNEELRKRYVEPMVDGETTVAFALSEPDHGSDITWLDTSAREDDGEWIVDGTKSWIYNATIADAVIVFARTSGDDGYGRGVSAFVVDTRNPGLELGSVQSPMGDSEAGRIARVHFDGCRVPRHRLVGSEGEALVEFAFPSIRELRLRLPAKAVGRSQWLFDQCVSFAERRETFGDPIGSRQFVQGMVADLRTRIESVRWLYRYAAWAHGEGSDERWLECAANLEGAELWNEAADTAIQIHGATGYSQDLPFESEYRDARASRIYEGTDEMQRQTIARSFLDLPDR